MTTPPQAAESVPASATAAAGRGASRADAWAVAALLVAVVLLFAPTLHFGLLHGWDDNAYVTNNVARLTFTPGNLAYWLTHDCVLCYLPLTMLSYMVDHAVWGLNALGYRLQNLFWHGVATLALFAVMRLLRLRPLPAFLAALLWAVHPQRVESVAWISERKDVLCAALYFSALAAYVRARRRDSRPGLALGLFVAALLAKSMAISLPVVLAAVEVHLWVSTQGRRWPSRAAWRSTVLRLLPFVLVALAFVPVTIAFQSIPVEETTTGRQLMVALHNLLWYGAKTVWAGGLCPIYPRLVFGTGLILGLVAAWLVLAALLAAAWRRAPGLVAGTVLPALAAYAAALAPVSGILPLGFVDMSDRYGYIPSAFLWILAGAALGALRQAASRAPAVLARQRHWRLALATVALLAMGYAGTGLLYGRVWRDIETLTRSACQREPANVFALGQLGNILLEAGRFDEVLVTGGRLAAADHPWMTPAARQRALAQGLYLQGFALFRLGQPEDALRVFETIAPQLQSTVFHEPTNNSAVYAMMAEVYLRQGEAAKALGCYDAILERQVAGSFEWHFYSAVRCLHAGDGAAARAHFRTADGLRPGNPLVRQNLERLGAPAVSAPPSP